MTNTNPFPDVFGQPGAASPIVANDLASMKTLLDQISASGEKASKTLSTGFGAAAASGKSFNDTLLAIAQSLAKVAMQEGAKSLATGLTNTLSDLFKATVAGNVPVTAHADGGVVASPTYFGNGASVGLMGERGAEAVMPLARGPDGRLGVVSQGDGAARPLAITVNIAAQDLDSFRRSEAQITGALARAVARGQRAL
jgi:phage-related minor tail protein